MSDSLALIAAELEQLAGVIVDPEDTRLDPFGLKLHELSERLDNERRWILTRAEAMAGRVNRAEGALGECRELFAELRGDWSDNRGPCREGMMIIDKVLEERETRETS